MQLSVIFAIIIGLSIAIFVIELVRRKKFIFKRQPVPAKFRERNFNITPGIYDDSVPETDDVKIIKTGHEKDCETQPAIIPNSRRSSLTDEKDIIIVNIMASQGKKFVGYDLLQALLSAGMRFGKMNIFHRHEEANGKGKTLFSLASATKPGTFDIHKMGGVSCLGLTMFMRISEHDNPLQVYDLMIKTATLLAEDLDGSLFNANHQPLTHDDISHKRQWIAEYQYQDHSESAYAANT